MKHQKPSEAHIVSKQAPGRLLAIVVAAGFAGLGVFQGALAAGAPLGSAAWGGTYPGRLPITLRIGSLITIVVYALAAIVVLRRAGFPIRWISATAARWGTWAFAIMLVLSALVNFLSASPWERFLFGPVALILAVLSLIVARHGERSNSGQFRLEEKTEIRRR